MLEALKKQVGPKGAGLSALIAYAKKKEIAAKKKSKLSAVAVKKAVKIAGSVGLTVTGMKLQPDGTLFIATEEKAAISASSAEANPWDEVLK